jgi:HEAT repeat protein
MKKIILLIPILIISSSLTYAQNSTRDSLAHQIDNYVNNVNDAANQFLNKKLSVTERIKAIEPYDIIYDQKQVEQFKSIVLDTNENPDIRATALNKIYQFVPGDDQLEPLMLGLLGDPQAPKSLRKEALELAENLSFASMDVPDVYQKMVEDPDYEFREFAFAKLIVHGDARAQQKLIEGLENPRLALLPAPTAIAILSMSLKKEFYPALYKILQQTNDEATKLEAISALGFYKAARPKLIAISRDAGEQEQFREAALDALYAGDRENIVTYVLPIVSDISAPVRLQVVGIQMAMDIRQSIIYRRKAHADNFDLLIKRLSKDKNRDIQLQQMATKYIQNVRPK